MKAIDTPAIRAAAVALSVEQYHRMGESGVPGEDTELLQGMVVKQMVKSPLHTLTVQRLVDWLRSQIGPTLHVRQEKPLTLADSEPETDVAVVEGPLDRYRDRHPCTAGLVIEVATTSVDVDRRGEWTLTRCSRRRYEDGGGGSVEGASVPGAPGGWMTDWDRSSRASGKASRRGLLFRNIAAVARSR